MLKQVLVIFCLFSLPYYLSAGVKTEDWNALEEEACILEQSINDVKAEIFPEKTIKDKDPETKMPEIGFFHSVYQSTISCFHCICLLTPFVRAINSFSGFTNQANAP